LPDWEDNNEAIAQAELLAFDQIRRIEEAEHDAMMAGAKF